MKPINKKLSLKGCWKMVNSIESANDPKEIRERCKIAEEWITANEVITNAEYDELMDAIAYIHRDSYHIN